MGMQQPQWAYVLTTDTYAVLGVFTWPNSIKKYIRDTYTLDGELHLPPPGHLVVTRHKVNPKAGARAVADVLSLEAFLSA